ncbi:MULTISPECIES: acyl carrier protein [Peribacillus]|uniref:acyl carrier protein n=1 Tax=Peribacillus TaxID=2675229 RepID=UPI0021A97C09|nr:MULTISPECIES: acyl carrier protein [Peribacillus]MDF1999841.1 acyl carrier protein [Peribacillus frigoritolerans]
MKKQIKLKFIEVYNMSDSLDDIKDDEDLFGQHSPYGLDSMDVLLFINELKKDFDLEYKSIDTESFKTINNIVAFVEKQKGTIEIK